MMTTEQLENENKRIHSKIEKESNFICNACWCIGATYIGIVGLFLCGW